DYPSSLGAVPCLYPAWLNPTLVQFSPQDLAGFGQGYRLTQAQDVFIVPTPGHSAGHQSVLLRESGRSYLFAGDASFDEAQLLGGKVAGIASDPASARQTLATIRTYCADQPTVYLPSHDPDAPARLRDGRTVTVTL
nr:MBL fold metallo-hydrolase [Anaerolineae bacterium]